jgi:uncharacterized protein
MRGPIRYRQDCTMDITVNDVPERERFEARDAEGNVVGFVTYQLTGKIIAYTHTEVFPEHEGQGIGSRLANAVMDDARAKSRNVVPICPYIQKWLEKRQEYDDIVLRDTRKVK